MLSRIYIKLTSSVRFQVVPLPNHNWQCHDNRGYGDQAHCSHQRSHPALPRRPKRHVRLLRLPRRGCRSLAQRHCIPASCRQHGRKRLRAVEGRRTWLDHQRDDAGGERVYFLAECERHRSQFQIWRYWYLHCDSLKGGSRG